MAQAIARSLFSCSSFAPFLVLLLVMDFQILQESDAATIYEVDNTALDTSGGQRFNTELGNDPMKQVLKNAAGYIQTAFSLSAIKDVLTLTLYVDNMDGVAYTSGNGIHLSANYVQSFQPGDTSALTYEITGVLYHESTHVWQNNNGNYGSDQYFRGTIEGMADTIRLRAGYPAKSWVKQRGGNWYDGYSTTAYFFDWIESKKSGFIDELNQKMAYTWSNDFFSQIVGTNVTELWNVYQNSF